MNNLKPKQLEKYSAILFSIIFCSLLLIVSIFFPSPTEFQYSIIRLLLAISAAGLTALIPTFLNLEFTDAKVIRASGAIAMFAFIYFANPIDIIVDNSAKKPPLPVYDIEILAVEAYESGDYSKSTAHLQTAIDLLEVSNAQSKAQLARIHSKMGLAWQAMGQYDKAIEHYEIALSYDLKMHRENHPNVAADLNNLGSVWQELGQYEKAIKYYERALSSNLKTYGNDHPRVANLWNNLGAAWQELGQYEKAIKYYERALSSNLKTYGNDHPSVATLWNNLGSAWQELGQYEKAIKYYKLSLASYIRIYGINHPRMVSLKNRISLLKGEGND